MDINKGFNLDIPNVFIPWEINENELLEIFKGYNLKFITQGYYTIEMESLSGLKCNIGFHFDPSKNGVLKELEFFRSKYDDYKKSFEEFQKYFENVFGKPNFQTNGTEGYKNIYWNFERVQISHYIFDRFGLEEHMEIKKIK